MNYIKNIISGIFIGAGAILPGISSGVICIVLGFYEKLINSILYFFKDIKNNLKFLLSIGTGSILGIFIFSKIILYCFNIIPCQTKSLFIGFLLGSSYILYKKELYSSSLNKKNISIYIPLILCFFIGISLIYLENIIPIFYNSVYGKANPFFLILTGFFMSIGIVVPGVSSTVILMLLGVYNSYLSAISGLNIAFLFPMVIGVIIGCFVFMIIINYLLNKYHSETMFGIIGFSIGSIFILYPSYALNLESIIGIILLILGYIIGKNIKEE